MSYSCHKISILVVITSQVSVKGLVVDKSQFTGPEWVRTDLTLTTEDERHRIVLKFSNEAMSHCYTTDIEEGQMLRATDMITGKWKRYPIHLTPTEETPLTTREMEAREKWLSIVGFDTDKSDNTVAVLCTNDLVYTISTARHCSREYSI